MGAAISPEDIAAQYFTHTSRLACRVAGDAAREHRLKLDATAPTAPRAPRALVRAPTRRSRLDHVFGGARDSWRRLRREVNARR